MPRPVLGPPAAPGSIVHAPFTGSDGALLARLFDILTPAFPETTCRPGAFRVTALRHIASRRRYSGEGRLDRRRLLAWTSPPGRCVAPATITTTRPTRGATTASTTTAPALPPSP